MWLLAYAHVHACSQRIAHRSEQQTSPGYHRPTPLCRLEAQSIAGSLRNRVITNAHSSVARTQLAPPHFPPNRTSLSASQICTGHQAPSSVAVDANHTWSTRHRRRASLQDFHAASAACTCPLLHHFALALRRRADRAVACAFDALLQTRIVEVVAAAACANAGG